jgi:hypothetical protein
MARPAKLEYFWGLSLQIPFQFFFLGFLAHWLKLDYKNGLA